MWNERTAKSPANPNRTRYQAQKFAGLAGVTVRTLHHYDRLGLLKPAGRSAAGYRLYDEASLERLQQVVTLKFIGLSLEEIKRLLSRRKFSLKAALRLQHWMIDAKRAHLERVAKVIDLAEGTPDWQSLRTIIDTIGKENPMEWTKKYYSDEAQKELAAKHDTDIARKGTEGWAELIQDVEAAVASGVKPASSEGQALAGRWKALIAAFTGGSKPIKAGLDKMYSDPSFKKPYSDEAGEFIAKAMKG